LEPPCFVELEFTEVVPGSGERAAPGKKTDRRRLPPLDPNGTSPG